MKSPVSRSRLRLGALALLLVLVGAGVAQENKPKPTPAQPPAAAAQPAPATAGQEPKAKEPSSAQEPGINEQFGRPLAEESSEAAGGRAEAAEKENAQEKMVRELKEGKVKSVRWIADTLHVSPAAGYWIGIILDFAVLAALIIFALKKNLPAAFRSRTVSIQRGIEEARKASAEANKRLADIEQRLARLGDEVAGMRAAAENEAAAEEQRIHAAAEQDAKRIVESAEAEIEAAAKLARRDLKTFAADLAVGLAERRIRVDQTTDQALVRSFTDQLGTPAGKDGK